MGILEVAFAQWVVLADVQQTRLCYAQLQDDPWDECGCDACKNFALVHRQAYPPEVLSFFGDLGVDLRKPFELSHYGRLPSGLHLYNGWHHFCGSVASGPQSGFSDPHRVHPTFQIAMFETHEARAPFNGVQCVQVEIYIELPWVIDLPEP